MDAREKIAAWALAHQPCSAHVNQPLYVEACVPVADRVPARIGYYIGPTPPSTCALFADECLAGAEIDHPPIEGHYVVGTAIGKLEQADGGRGLYLGTPERDLRKGDIVVIDNGSGQDAHVMVIVGDAVHGDSYGSYKIDTVEGGQAPDSSGVQAFTGEHARTFMARDGRLWCGHRYVVALIDPDDLVIPDDAAPDTGDPSAPPVT